MIDAQQLGSHATTKVGGQAGHDPVQKLLFKHVNGPHLRTGSLTGLSEIKWHHLRRGAAFGAGGTRYFVDLFREFLLHGRFRLENQKDSYAVSWLRRQAQYSVACCL